ARGRVRARRRARVPDARRARLLQKGAHAFALARSDGGASLLPRQLPAARTDGRELHLPLLLGLEHVAATDGRARGKSPARRDRARLRAAVPALPLSARIHTAPRTPDLATHKAVVCPPHRSPQGPPRRAPSFDSRALRRPDVGGLASGRVDSRKPHERNGAKLVLISCRFV